MTIYKPDEIELIREGGQILSDILRETALMVRPGITAKELDAFAEKRIREAGGEPSFLHYQTDHSDPPFPSTVCISLDDEVVHGPATERKLEEGSIVKLDIGMRYRGFCTDMATTVPVGRVSDEARKLALATYEALRIGIKNCQPGNFISDIGKAVDKHVKAEGFSTVKDLVGHGVGHKVHEEPQVPNFFDRHLRPVKIVPGMVLAIEPMVNVGTDFVDSLDDGWTIVTEDGKLSAHFEATVAVKKGGVEIMTPIVNLWE